MISGMLGLSDCSGRPSSPVRLLNMGSVDSGGGALRLPAMFLSSSVFPWMVWWWYSWILQHRGTFKYFLMHKIGLKDEDKGHKAKLSYISKLDKQWKGRADSLVCPCISFLSVGKTQRKKN